MLVKNPKLSLTGVCASLNSINEFGRCIEYERDVVLSSECENVIMNSLSFLQ